MGIISGRLPSHTITKRSNGTYMCVGGNNRGYGVPEDNYEDVAEDIMTELGLWEKKDGL